MGLSLVVGPAHAGKVALLLERYVDALERDPWLVVPNRLDVDRVERDLIRRRPALLAGTIGTFDDLFRAIADDGREGPADRVGYAARLGHPTRGWPLASSTIYARRPRRRASRTPCSRRIGELESALVDPRWARGRAPATRRRVPRRAGAPRLARSRRRPAGSRRAAPRRPRRLGRRAGLRVRLRGSDRRRVGSARGARGAHGGHGLDPVRARSCRLRGPVANGRGSRGPCRRRDRGAAAIGTPDDASGAGSPRARALLRRPGAGAVARRSDPLPRRRGDARNRRARSPARSPHCSGAAPLPSESRSSASPSIAGARRSRRRSRSSRFRCAVEHARRLGETPLGRALARDSPLRVARGQSRRPLRVPALAVLGARASVGRLRRGPPARPGGQRTRRGSTRRARSSAARPCRRSPTSGRTTILVAAARSLIALMMRNAWGARVASDDRRRPDRRACLSSGRAHARRARRARVRGRSSVTTDDVLAALERTQGRSRKPGARKGRRARPRARADACVRRRVRPRARGGCVPAPREAVAAPERRAPQRARRSARATGLRRA